MVGLNYQNKLLYCKKYSALYHKTSITETLKFWMTSSSYEIVDYKIMQTNCLPSIFYYLFLHLVQSNLTTNLMWVFMWWWYASFRISWFWCTWMLFLQSHARIKIWKMILFCIRYAYFNVFVSCYNSRSRLECVGRNRGGEKCA